MMKVLWCGKLTFGKRESIYNTENSGTRDRGADFVSEEWNGDSGIYPCKSGDSGAVPHVKNCAT